MNRRGYVIENFLVYFDERFILLLIILMLFYKFLRYCGNIHTMLLFFKTFGVVLLRLGDLDRVA